MATTKTDDAKVKRFIAKAQAREDRHRALRVNRIKRAIAVADLVDGELYELEQILFRAYGRTKLGA